MRLLFAFLLVFATDTVSPFVDANTVPMPIDYDSKEPPPTVEINVDVEDRTARERQSDTEKASTTEGNVRLPETDSRFQTTGPLSLYGNGLRSRNNGRKAGLLPKCSTAEDCSTVLNSECNPDDGDCVCTAMFIENEEGQCIPKVELNKTCVDHVQCAGKNAVCDQVCKCPSSAKTSANGMNCENRAIGDDCSADPDCGAVEEAKCSEKKKKCACPPERPAVSNEKCSVPALDAPCLRTEDCGPIHGVICKEIKKNRYTCQCNNDTIKERNSCRPKILGDVCKSTSDCRAVLSAACNTSGRCDCFGAFSTGTTNKTCEPKGLDAPCETTDDCVKVDYAECSKGNTGTKSCNCKAQYSRNGSQCKPKLLGSKCPSSADCSLVANATCSLNSCVCAGIFDIEKDGKHCRQMEFPINATCGPSGQCSRSKNITCSASNMCECATGYSYDPEKILCVLDKKEEGKEDKVDNPAGYPSSHSLHCPVTRWAYDSSGNIEECDSNPSCSSEIKTASSASTESEQLCAILSKHNVNDKSQTFERGPINIDRATHQNLLDYLKAKKSLRSSCAFAKLDSDGHAVICLGLDDACSKPENITDTLVSSLSEPEAVGLFRWFSSLVNNQKDTWERDLELLEKIQLVNIVGDKFLAEAEPRPRPANATNATVDPYRIIARPPVRTYTTLQLVFMGICLAFAVVSLLVTVAYTVHALLEYKKNVVTNQYSKFLKTLKRHGKKGPPKTKEEKAAAKKRRLLRRRARALARAARKNQTAATTTQNQPPKKA